MAEKKDLVEDALLQMKNLEEAVAQNAKGILAATMGQEIKELVKESLSEQDDEEDETGLTDMGSEDMDMSDDEEFGMEDMDMSDDEESGMEDMDMSDDESGMEDMDMSDDDEVVDLTNASDEEILKVFKAMGDEDGIIVKKDDDMIHLEDTNEGSEYLIDLEESETDETFWGAFEDEESEGTHDEMEESTHDEESEGVMYEISLDEDEMDEGTHDEMEESTHDEESEGVMYEISLDDDDDDEDDDDEDEMEEGYNFEKVETKEGNMSVKPKGVGMGKAKFSYKKPSGGFKDDMKQGTRGVGMGKGPKKFEYKEGKKMETKEASRTLGAGKAFGKQGLPKKKTAPRHLHTESISKTENLKNQVEVLREKNEEYRKALNIFRQKLNEVAVFNSNLAYATRLFTEHTTTKQEKINILRRFDGVESIKESKSLYKTLKDELSGKQGKVVTESFEKVIDRDPQSGSAINLIESKTYENPQFLRMKDLMSKLTK